MEPLSIIAIVVSSITAIGVIAKTLLHKDPETGNISIKSSCCTFNNGNQSNLRRSNSN